MPSNDAEYQKAYQKEYRRKRREQAKQAEATPLAADPIPDTPKRQPDKVAKAPKTQPDQPLDYRPVITAMTQQQRNAILSKMPSSPRRGS